MSESSTRGDLCIFWNKLRFGANWSVLRDYESDICDSFLGKQMVIAQKSFFGRIGEIPICADSRTRSPIVKEDGVMNSGLVSGGLGADWGVVRHFRYK